jgi:Superinfection immunity protein
MDAGAFWFFFFLILFLAIYFLPTIVAMLRGHNNSAAILIVNLFLGWTFLGWVASLAWSCTNNITAVSANVNANVNLKSV